MHPAPAISVCDKISAINYYLEPKDWKSRVVINYAYFHRYRVYGVGKYRNTVLADFELAGNMWRDPLAPLSSYSSNSWVRYEFHDGPWVKFIDELYEKATVAAEEVKNEEAEKHRAKEEARAKKFTPTDY